MKQKHGAAHEHTVNDCLLSLIEVLCAQVLSLSTEQ